LLAGCGEELVPPRPEEAVQSAEIVDRLTESGDGNAVHLVRLVQRGDQYAFEPAHFSIPSGDVLRFVLAGPQPESVAFDPGAATPEAAAFIRERSLHLGTLLVEPGQAYDVSFRDAPVGQYPFVSVPHGLQGMKGMVEVIE